MADELDAQVQKYERRLAPRTRVEIEADLEEVRTVWAPKVDRYNELVQQRFAIDAELTPLRSQVLGFERAKGDLDWEYFQRLQLDGFIPAMPRMTPDAVYRFDNFRVGEPTSNDNEGDEDDGDDSSADFEVGEKG